MTAYELLALPMQANDADAPTIGAYLGLLLLTLWQEEEGFSGKRPFGNSGWKRDVYADLVRGSALPGTFLQEDEGGSLDEVDSEAADELVCTAIRGLFGLDDPGEAAD